MKRPIVIVDPISAGVTLPPVFKRYDVPAIGVTQPCPDWAGYGKSLKAEDFILLTPEDEGLLERLKAYQPLAVLPGTEEGVPLADKLALALTPAFANDPAKSAHRLHKRLMQDALLESEVPALLTLDSASEQEVEAWIVANHLQASPLIIKPPMSAGSDKVFYIEPGANWRPAFQRVLTEPTQTTGIVSQTAVVQERAIGQEYAVGTVSANGKHHISHIIRYTKASAHGRDTLFDYVEFIAYDEQQHGALIHYVRAVLDALGIRWGATHTEIIVTERGPRLIDFGARMCEGPVVEFSRAATGSSQADRLAEAILQGSIAPSCFTLKQTVRPVFLRAPLAGILRNAEIFDATDQLPTLFKRFVFFENGQRVPQTVDYMTSLGIIALAGEPQAVAEDYKTIRNLEAQLQVSEH